MKGIFFATALILTFGPAYAQKDGEKQYTLQDFIQIAKNQSIAAKQAETTKENRYWQYQTYRSNYKPQLGLDGEFPGFNRSYDEVRQPDGSYEFLPVSINNSNVNLRLSQSIGATGTRVFLNSGINRFDNFANSDHYWIYSGTPLEVGIVQPLFQFNSLSWDKKIEPLRYEESKRSYLEDLENVSVNITRRFFDLMLAQIDLGIAQKNLANNDTIYKIAQGRYNLGKIAENELLQLELTVMNARQAVAQAKLDLEVYTLRLRTSAGLTSTENFQLVLPDQIPDFDVDEQKALTEAKNNRTDIISYERRKLEANEGIARAKGETGLNANLSARVGLTNRTANNEPVGGLYRDPIDQQIVTMQLQIPILDWGRRKSRVKSAEANQQLVEYTVNQDELNFNEEVLTQVRQFTMLKDKIKITRLANEIGQKRYNISKNRYMIGKIAITDLNIALQEKDQATARYIQSLEDFWLAYYTLRRLTLYDFQNGLRIKIPE